MNDLAVVLFVSLLCHLWGDYLLQSDSMAFLKRKSAVFALLHAAFYTLPFLVVTRDMAALAIIGGTHAVIDRFGLARYLVFAKNLIGPESSTDSTASKYQELDGSVTVKIKNTTMYWWHPWSHCDSTGYHNSKPPFLAVWLLIIADNTLHLTINTAVLIWRHV